MDSILEIQNLSLSFGSKTIFQEINLQVFPRDVYAVWGSSGSGKSTLLRALAGLVPITKGSVRFEGTDLTLASRKALQDLRTRMGMVFQEGALISNMSVYDNIALPLRYHFSLDEGEVQRRTRAVMDLLGVDREFDRAIPAQISMGLRKRAAFARALILEPLLLLLDEPTQGLEDEATRGIVQVLKRYQERTGAAILFTTNDQPLTLALASRVGLLKNGRILFDGAPQEILARMGKEKAS